MNFLIFLNPYLRYRKEEFGGVVRLELKTLLINQAQYDFIFNLKKYLIFNELNEKDKKIAENLLEHHILLKVDIKRARELGYKR